MLRLRRFSLLRFLPLLALVAGGVGAAPAGHPEPPSAEAWARLPEHPRLFARAAEWSALKARLAEDKIAAQLAALVRAQAEGLLPEAPVTIRQRNRGAMSGSMLEPAREVQRRVLLLAAAARLTDDARFVDRALVELRVLTALPDWNPAVFLDTAEATLAVAVGYDWLYDRLAPADRDTLARALIEKGLRASFDSPARMLSWVRGTNNWNQVCHGALVVGALAVAERDPALAQRTVQRAIEGLPSSAKAYAPDGVYPEGPGYWSYGTMFHVAMLSALESALGTRCGLDTFPGFLATADYIAQVTAPSGDVFNYADSSLHGGLEPILFWFARQLQQPLARPAMLSSLATKRPRAGKYSRFLPFALFWWDPATAARPARPLPLHWQAGGAVPLAVQRSAWDDPRAVYVALKGGRAGSSHGHMDAGSFILEADGVRWAIDPGMQSYGTIYEAGIDSGLWNFKQDSPRWSVFRIGAEGHNILRFDGALPRVDGTVTLARSRGEGVAPPAQFDLSAAYRGQVVAARRGAMLRPDRRVVLQDEWTAGAQATAVAWQWLTFAEAQPEARGALLRQGRETLRLRILEPADATVTVEDTAPLLRPHDQPNPGLRRIVIRTSTPAGASGRLVVVAEPGSAPGDGTVAVRPLAEW